MPPPQRESRGRCIGLPDFQSLAIVNVTKPSVSESLVAKIGNDQRARVFKRPHVAVLEKPGLKLGKTSRFQHAKYRCDNVHAGLEQQHNGFTAGTACFQNRVGNAIGSLVEFVIRDAAISCLDREPIWITSDDHSKRSAIEVFNIFNR
jgi:hypothetical protein